MSGRSPDCFATDLLSTTSVIDVRHPLTFAPHISDQPFLAVRDRRQTFRQSDRQTDSYPYSVTRSIFWFARSDSIAHLVFNALQHRMFRCCSRVILFGKEGDHMTSAKALRLCMDMWRRWVSTFVTSHQMVPVLYSCLGRSS